MTAEYKAKWSGKWPNLCRGCWTLHRDGKDISEKIPEYLKQQPMQTFGTYNSWHFRKNWEVVWKSYESGLSSAEWREENQEWLKEITTDTEEQKAIFEAFQKEDRRHESCGGCI